MPTLSIFFGIVIRMYYDDHPPPHFHAIYGEHEAKIGIETLELVEGKPTHRIVLAELGCCRVPARVRHCSAAVSRHWKLLVRCWGVPGACRHTICRVLCDGK